MKVKWEQIESIESSPRFNQRSPSRRGELYRAKVPGGWLVLWDLEPSHEAGAGGLTFYPDPDHKWDGNSLL